MTEQELLQENEKLKARLQKAITVFGEQKTNIQRLTDERDSARNELAKVNERVSELEAASKDKDENDTKFFEQLQEIDDLSAAKKQLEENLNDVQTKLASTAELLQNTTADLESVTKHNEDLEKNLKIICDIFVDFGKTSKAAMQNIAQCLKDS